MRKISKFFQAAAYLAFLVGMLGITAYTAASAGYEVRWQQELPSTPAVWAWILSVGLLFLVLSQWLRQKKTYLRLMRLWAKTLGIRINFEGRSQDEISRSLVIKAKVVVALARAVASREEVVQELKMVMISTENRQDSLLREEAELEVLKQKKEEALKQFRYLRDLACAGGNVVFLSPYQYLESGALEVLEEHSRTAGDRVLIRSKAQDGRFRWSSVSMTVIEKES